MKQTTLNLWQENEILTSANYDIENEIIYNTDALKSNLCDYNHAYISVRCGNAIIGHQAKQIASALFNKCITKIDGTAIDDAEDLDLAMPMYNLIERSSNCFETTGRLWFYSKDEATSFNADIPNTDDFKYFKYKDTLLGNTAANGTNGVLRTATIAIPLK